MLDIQELIKKAQQGNEESHSAANELLYYISEKYRDRKLQRYFARGMSYADREDIRQAFLIGCYNGILEARLDIGDPIAFILTKGMWASAEVIRSDGQKNLQQQCTDCKRTSRPNRIKSQYTCPACGSGQVKFSPKVTSRADIIEIGRHDQEQSIIIKEFRDQLTGRKREVFDLIMHGYDRDNCQNYLREIADILGISTSNVNMRLRQIRTAWTQYQSIS